MLPAALRYEAMTRGFHIAFIALTAATVLSLTMFYSTARRFTVTTKSDIAETRRLVASGHFTTRDLQGFVQRLERPAPSRVWATMSYAGLFSVSGCLIVIAALKRPQEKDAEVAT